MGSRARYKIATLSCPQPSGVCGGKAVGPSRQASSRRRRLDKNLGNAYTVPSGTQTGHLEKLEIEEVVGCFLSQPSTCRLLRSVPVHHNYSGTLN